MTRYEIARGLVLGKSCCGVCQEFKVLVKKRRLCTQYAEEESNFMTSCKDCFNEQNEYYKERWQDYYAGAL